MVRDYSIDSVKGVCLLHMFVLHIFIIYGFLMQKVPHPNSNLMP